MFASQNLFSSIVFFSSALFLAGAANINIGAIVNTGFRVGREQKVAMEIAAQHFNSSSSPIFLGVSELSNSSDPFEVITRGSTLIPLVSWMNCFFVANGMHAFVGVAAKDPIRWGAEAIIGTGTWPEVATLSKAGDTARIPVLSLAATPTSSSRMPFVLQMSYPAAGEVRCLAAIIRSFNWRRVIVIYEDDIYGSSSGVLALLSDVLRDSGSQIDHYIVFPPLRTTDMIRRKLKGILRQQSKVFVLLRSSPELTVELFKQANKLGMMAKDHVWIVNDDITALLDSTLTPSFISSNMQGVIGISTYFNTTTSSYRAFSSEFQQRFKQEYELKGEHRFEPGRHAVRAYDAVHAIANAAAAATASKAENRSVTTLQAILSTNFTGLSGFIGFTRDGFLPELRGRSAFRVLNVVGKSYKDIGFWSEGYGFFENEAEMSRHGRVVDVLRPVFWPGGTETIPGGWGKLKIGIPNATSFNQFVKVEYDKDGKLQPTGFCMDVFGEILKHLNYGLLYEFESFDGSYDDLVNKVPSQVFLQEVDAVVGDITILAKRAVNATFTEPFLSSGLSMLVPVKPNHTPWMFTKPFTKEVWLLILAALVYTAGVVWYLERESNPEFQGTRWVQLGATLWLILSTFFFAHGEQNRSRLPSHSIIVSLSRNSIYFHHAGRVYSYYTKTVVIVWLVVVLILTTSFTASLSSILIFEMLKPVPPGSRVGCDGDSFVLKYLQEVLHYNNSRIEAIGQPEEYVEAFKSGNITAAYLETPYLRVFLSQHQGFSRCLPIFLNQAFQQDTLGTCISRPCAPLRFCFTSPTQVFPKNSPLADDFSQVILQLAENGTLKELENKWFTFTLSNSPAPDNKVERDSLSLDSFWALFLFTGCTSTIVLLLFIARSKLLNGTSTPAAASPEPLRRSLMALWPSTKNLSPREGLELPKVLPISSHQEGFRHAHTADVV
ncbi:hypothetical protein B296_00017291 [Ensete ventricosum]|uniref:Ionotropic glutamate receptor C-terminal domain-containing protein n=1 Tax=Ensete ventricosum TaxID=4639 RepID=A0A427AW25_ENSVE|nr:hypothetical protein B296_00017291 [Ensete ventricosum]